MCWPNPIVTFVAKKVRQPIMDRYTKIIQDKWFSDPGARIGIEKDRLDLTEARHLAYVELLRVLLDHTEFAERYMQIVLLYLRTLSGRAGYIDILRARPWQT